MPSKPANEPLTAGPVTLAVRRELGERIAAGEFAPVLLEFMALRFDNERDAAGLVALSKSLRDLTAACKASSDVADRVDELAARRRRRLER